MTSDTNIGPLRRFCRTSAIPLALVTTVLIAMGGCGDDPEANGNNDQISHGLLNGIELETRGTPETTVAVWDVEDGWQDEDGDSIDELPDPVQVDSGDIFPLEEGGQNASLTVRYIDSDGDEFDMDTVSRDDDTGERECTEYSTRYFPTEDDSETDVIAWPNITHPDNDDRRAPAQFAETTDGDIVGLFHCDHIHIYPEEAGTVDIEFLLWHIDHSDDASDPLTVRVEESSE